MRASKLFRNGPGLATTRASVTRFDMLYLTVTMSLRNDFLYRTTISDFSLERNYWDVDFAYDKRTAPGAVLLCQKAEVIL
jgi:hypothetical protein